VNRWLGIQSEYVQTDSHVSTAERMPLLLHIGTELAARGKLQLIFKLSPSLLERLATFQCLSFSTAIASAAAARSRNFIEPGEIT